MGLEIVLWRNLEGDFGEVRCRAARQDHTDVAEPADEQDPGLFALKRHEPDHADVVVGEPFNVRRLERRVADAFDFDHAALRPISSRAWRGAALRATGRNQACLLLPGASLWRPAPRFPAG